MPHLTAATLFALVIVAPAAASETPPATPLSVQCEVSGYDVLLINSGTEDLPTGTVIAWSVERARSAGQETLTRPLSPDRFVLLTGANGESYLGTGVPCTAALE